MITIEQPEIFGKTIAQALVKIETSSLTNYTKKRWSKAVAKAVVQIEDFGNWMDWQENETLLIWSDNSNAIYEANGVCQCESFKRGNPCWHKAAKQLVKNYLAALQTEAAAVLAEVEADTEAWLYLNEILVPRSGEPGVKKRDDCDCWYNWNDHFTEKFCPKHQAEQDEADAAESYYEEHFDIQSFSDAPYLKSGGDKPTTKIGNIRF